MAVYGRTYRSYTGALTSERTRFLVLPRYNLLEILRSRVFLAFLALCLMPALITAIRIYLGYNAEAINVLKLPQGLIEQLLAVDVAFFRNWVMIPQSIFAFLLAMFVGPALISPDLRNNAMPLYLARPITRREYVMGKLVVLVVLLSAVTWVPGLLLFAFQSFLAGFDWFQENFWAATAILLSSLLWIAVLSLSSLAVSAWVKWKPIARLLFLALPFIVQSMGAILDVILQTTTFSIVQITSLLRSVWAGLFGLSTANLDVSPIAAWVVLLLICGASVLLLARKVRAYEVEK